MSAKIREFVRGLSDDEIESVLHEVWKEQRRREAEALRDLAARWEAGIR